MENTEKLTKDELQKMFQKEFTEKHNLIEQDKNRRKEFAKSFGWFELSSDRWSTERNKTYETPSWEQIFVHVGRLLNTQRFTEHEDRLEDMQQQLFDLSEKERLN